MKKIYTLTAIILSLSLSFGGCGADTKDNGDTDVKVNASDVETVGNAPVEGGVPVYEIDVSDAFSNRDSKTDYDSETATYITLADGGSNATSEAVIINGDTVTITDEGDYVISGTLSNGTIKVDAEKTDKIHVILNGVTLHSATSAAIYVKTADKVFITLEAGSENALYTDGDYVAIDENDVDAVVFSKEDITFNGDGKLTVVGGAGHGIVSKDDLKFTGGVYVITAGGHGISGKDRLYVKNGEFDITAGKDGVHSENADDTSLGLLLIAGGKLNVTADGDGIQGGAAVQIDGGELTVVSGGGSENGRYHTDDMGGMGGWWGSYEDNGSDTSADTVSTKGIKSDGKIIVNEGNVKINSADDGIHGGGDVNVTGGTLEVATGDDGVHSDADVTVGGGEVKVTESYEGIEGVIININGGNVSINASDDGMNAAGVTSTGGGMGGFGGGMMDGSDEYGINITGGKLYVNANGDGIDSNGFITVSGGETYVDGPTNSGNGALDYGTTATVSGGIFVAVGASGMAENFSESSTQGTIMCSLTSFVNYEVKLTDEEGGEIISYAPSKQYSSVIVSTPEIKPDGTYVIYAGTASMTIEMNGYVYGGGNGMGGMGGMGGNPGGGPGGGGRPGGRPGR